MFPVNKNILKKTRLYNSVKTVV